MNAGFARPARVRTRTEFDLVFKQGRRVTVPMLALHLLADGRPPRLGLAVSRKVDGRAVARNRIKRRLREQFRNLRGQLPNGAYVLVARTAAANASNDALRAAFSELLKRAGALPPPVATGTMPPASASSMPPAHPSTSEPSGGSSLPAP